MDTLDTLLQHQGTQGQAREIHQQAAPQTFSQQPAAPQQAFSQQVPQQTFSQQPAAPQQAFSQQGLPPFAQTTGRSKIEEYIQNGGFIVSEHPNIRGQDYHTVVVQLPDGHKQAFSNVKSDLLEQILTRQSAPQQATAGQAQPNIDFGRLPPDARLQELINQGAKITA
jgi:hypothetical protein